MNNMNTNIRSTEAALQGGISDVFPGSQKAHARRKIQLACNWSAVPMLLMLFIGLWPIAGFIPPHHPWSSAAVIAGIYRTNTGAIRFGLALSFLSLLLFYFFGAATTAQARRIEGKSPVLTYVMITGIAAGSIIYIIPWCTWLTAAFRPERADTEIFLLNDFAWITFVMSFLPYSAWNVALGIVMLSDARKKPVFPRWLGYFNLFTALSFVPDICVPFFKGGPFSWEGIFPFYLPYVVYGLWVLLQMWYTSKAIMEDPDLA
jgi:hypothetical protein